MPILRESHSWAVSFYCATQIEFPSRSLICCLVFQKKW